MQKGSVFHSKSIVWSGTKAAHTKMYLYICSLIVLLSAKNLLHATQGANTNLDEALMPEPPATITTRGTPSATFMAASDWGWV